MNRTALATMSRLVRLLFAFVALFTVGAAHASNDWGSIGNDVKIAAAKALTKKGMKTDPGDVALGRTNLPSNPGDFSHHSFDYGFQITTAEHGTVTGTVPAQVHFGFWGRMKSYEVFPDTVKVNLPAARPVAAKARR